MTVEHKEVVPSKGSSETKLPSETPAFTEKDASNDSKNQHSKNGEDYENIKYPEPWKYEKFFIGGYKQNRMLKFKKPKTMYTAINLFAGESIDFCCLLFDHGEC